MSLFEIWLFDVSLRLETIRSGLGLLGDLYIQVIGLALDEILVESGFRHMLKLIAFLEYPHNLLENYTFGWSWCLNYQGVNLELYAEFQLLVLSWYKSLSRVNFGDIIAMAYYELDSVKEI